MVSYMLSMVKLKLCRVVYQGPVSNGRFYTMLAFRMFELVAAIQICIQNWPNFEDISHDIYQKTQQTKTPSRTLTEHYQLI